MTDPRIKTLEALTKYLQETPSRLPAIVAEAAAHPCPFDPEVLRKAFPMTPTSPRHTTAKGRW